MRSALDEDRSKRDDFLSVNGQTSFTPTRKCINSSIVVWLNGQMLPELYNYTVGPDGTVTFDTPRLADETVALYYTLG